MLRNEAKVHQARFVFLKLGLGINNPGSLEQFIKKNEKDSSRTFTLPPVWNRHRSFLYYATTECTARKI